MTRPGTILLLFNVGNLCSKLDVLGGVINTTAYYYGTAVSVSCGRGYILPVGISHSDMVTTCQADSTWTKHIPDCDRKYLSEYISV